jgi:hypothetical protein
VITQAQHAAMCEELAAAWGNERFGALEPADEVRRAAGQHELGWAPIDGAPTLDTATGLPTDVFGRHFAIRHRAQIDGPCELARHSPHAALLASLHHSSLYARPRPLGLLRRDGRRMRAFFTHTDRFQAELRARLQLDDAQVQRNWRLVRVWDGLSHDLLYERAPCVRRSIPAAGGTTLDVRIERAGSELTLDPWPFRADTVSVEAHGRLLERTFTDEAAMRAALDAAPPVVLTYALTRA